IMEFLNQRVPVSRQIEIDQHNRESEALYHLKRLFRGRSQEHLPVTIQYFTGFFKSFWIVIDDKNHKRFVSVTPSVQKGVQRLLLPNLSVPEPPSKKGTGF